MYACDGAFWRDLAIRQRRRSWKRRWEIDFASFQFISQLFQVAQLLKRREFGLELKRRDRAQVLTEMVEFITLAFPFPSRLKIWSFHVAVMQTAKKCTKKRDARAELLFCSLNLLLFWRSRCRRRRSFARSLITWTWRVLSYYIALLMLKSGQMNYNWDIAHLKCFTQQFWDVNFQSVYCYSGLSRPCLQGWVRTTARNLNGSAFRLHGDL